VSGGYDRHLTRVRRALLLRRDAMLDALAREMPDGVRWTEPEGGLQLWVELPDSLDTAALLADAVRAGVLFAPAFQFRDHRPEADCGSPLSARRRSRDPPRRRTRSWASCGNGCARRRCARWTNACRYDRRSVGDDRLGFAWGADRRLGWWKRDGHPTSQGEAAGAARVQLQLATPARRLQEGMAR
jgi:hypothetical protein